MTTPDAQSTALATLRGEVMTALVELKGDVRLLIAQGEHAVRRAYELDAKHTSRADASDRKVERLDERMDALEVTAVRRDELKARESERSRRNLALAGLAMTGTGIVSGAGVALLTTLIK